MKKRTALSRFWNAMVKLVIGDQTPVYIRQRTHNTKRKGQAIEWQIVRSRKVIDRFASYDDAVTNYPYAIPASVVQSPAQAGE